MQTNDNTVTVNNNDSTSSTIQSAILSEMDRDCLEFQFAIPSATYELALGAK